jgi:hypothetical protein
MRARRPNWTWTDPALSDFRRELDPNGQPQCRLDVTEAEQVFGRKVPTRVREALERAIARYGGHAHVPA